MISSLQAQREPARFDYIKKLGRPIEFSWSTRFDILMRIEDSLLVEMKDAGCRILGLGIESGSARMLEIIGKKYRDDDVLHQLDRLKRVGILPTVSIMVGQHTETKEDVEASVRIVRESLRNDPNVNYYFSVMTPFPGSPLYNTVLQQGLVRDHQDFYDRYWSARKIDDFRLVVNMSAMTDDEVLAARNRLFSTYEEHRPKRLAERTVTSYNLDVKCYRETFGAECARVDLALCHEDRDLVLRVVTEMPEGVSLSQAETDRWLDNMKFPDGYLLEVLAQAFVQFPQLKERYLSARSHSLRPFVLPNMGHCDQWGRRRLRWFLVHVEGAPEKHSPPAVQGIAGPFRADISVAAPSAVVPYCE